MSDGDSFEAANNSSKLHVANRVVGGGEISLKSIHVISSVGEMDASPFTCNGCGVSGADIELGGVSGRSGSGISEVEFVVVDYKRKGRKFYHARRQILTRSK
jgi:hypothetical protein